MFQYILIIWMFCSFFGNWKNTKCQTSLAGPDSIKFCTETNPKTGALIRRFSERNGKPNGQYEEWFPNGKIESNLFYNNGKLVDTSVFYRDDGSIETQYSCNHTGDQCAIYGYYGSGEKEFYGKDRNHIPVDTNWEWYSNGKVESMKIYGSRGDTDYVKTGWSETGVLLDSFVVHDSKAFLEKDFYPSGRLKLFRKWKAKDYLSQGQSFDTTGKLTGTVEDGTGFLIYPSLDDGSMIFHHYIDGVDQNALSQEQITQLMKGQKVSAMKFDRYPDSTVRCMYTDLGGDIGMIYAVCYTPDGKKTSEVMKGEGTLIVPRLDGKGSEKRVFHNGKEVAPSN